MSRPVTQSEVLGGVLPRTQKAPEAVDSPSERASARRAPARARIADTDSDRKSQAPEGGWWVWNGRPATLKETWRESAINTTRIPLDSKTLARGWRISNWTDRPVMFLLLFLAPAGLAGPLRWIAARPTRRIPFYILLLVVVAAFYLTSRP